MTNASRYMRKFVILENDVVNFSKKIMSNAKGYVKIEVRDGKGKVSFNVEGLEKVDEDDRVYKGYLLAKEQGKLVEVDVGTIIIDENGKGNIEWKFNANSVGNTGLSIEHFKAAIVKLSWIDGKDSDIVIPLAGYIYERDQSIEELARELKKEITDDSTYEKKSLSKDIIVEHIDIEELESVHNEENQIEPDIEMQDEEKVTEPQINALEIENIQDVEENIQELDNGQKVEKEEILEKIEQEKVEEKEGQKLEEKQENELLEDEESIKKASVQGNESDEKIIQNSEKENIKPTNQQSEYKFIEDEDDKDSYFVKGQEQEDRKETKYDNIKYEYEDFRKTYGHPINKGYNHIESIRNYSKQVVRYTMNILKFFEKVEPFNGTLDGYTWWKIDYDRKNIYRGFLPFYNYIVNMYYPYPLASNITTCQSLMKKYNHYLFGIVGDNDNVKYYVYGIPGKFTRKEQPYRGMTGFQTWIEQGGRNREKLGYWIIHIDAVTGRIVNPLKSTTPRR